MTPGPFSGPRALGEREQLTLRDRTVLSHRRVWLGAFETRETSRDLADLVMGDPSRMFWPGWHRYFALTKFVTNATPPAVAATPADLRLLGFKKPKFARSENLALCWQRVAPRGRRVNTHVT
jgi:hypothetical protein